MAKRRNNNGKTINTQAAMDKAIKGVCDILRRDKAFHSIDFSRTHDHFPEPQRREKTQWVAEFD